MKKNYFKIRVFGWSVYLTREKLSVRRNRGRKARVRLKKAMLEARGYRCENCGAELKGLADSFHVSRLGADRPCEERYSPENSELLCSKCNWELKKALAEAMQRETLTRRYPVAAVEGASGEGQEKSGAKGCSAAAAGDDDEDFRNYYF